MLRRAERPEVLVAPFDCRAQPWPTVEVGLGSLTLFPGRRRAADLQQCPRVGAGLINPFLKSWPRDQQRLVGELDYRLARCGVVGNYN